MILFDRVSAGKPRRTADGRVRHGMRGTPEYSAWCGMKSRCLSPTHAAYGRYGGRGITVCKRWQDSFEAFYQDMGQRPSARHTLERIDNDAGYSPSNCQWREWEQQNRNRRNTVMVDWNGESVPLAFVAESTGLNYYFLWRRIVDLGWSVDEAITAPRRSVRHRK